MQYCTNFTYIYSKKKCTDKKSFHDLGQLQNSSLKKGEKLSPEWPLRFTKATKKSRILTFVVTQAK